VDHRAAPGIARRMSSPPSGGRPSVTLVGKQRGHWQLDAHPHLDFAHPVDMAASTVPVLGGGRIRTPEEGRQCPDLGAFAIVGTVIHT
jgi:putative N-acetylmannosamine-6-phosphate epimerase